MELCATKRLVHIVDDDPNVRDSLALLLHVMGYDACAYPNGHAFLEKAAVKAKDILLFDLHMADMDGFTLLTQARLQHPEHPALLMTGHGCTKVEHKASLLGFQAVLHKPFSEIELGKALDVAIAGER